MRYSAEADFLRRVEDPDDTTNRRRCLSEPELQRLRADHPRLPDDFLDYLREIGAGTFRECQFQVQDYLFTPDDLGLGDLYPVGAHVRFFGDNFSGDFSGFDLAEDSGHVIELWHEDGTVYETGRSFGAYIRERMLIGADGRDERE